jgi:hypothetical protein
MIRSILIKQSRKKNTDFERYKLLRQLYCDEYLLQPYSTTAIYNEGLEQL